MMAGPSLARLSASGRRFASEFICASQAVESQWFDASLGPSTVRFGMRTEDDLSQLIRGAFLRGTPSPGNMRVSVARAGELPRLPPMEWARGWIETGQAIPDEITLPYRIAFDRQVGVIYALDTETQQGAVWVRRPSELDRRSFITPFRLMLSWLSGLFGGEVVHASAVVVRSAGLLLSGASGSGKSTTALALALRGHALIADDCVLVHRGRVHAIYARAKVDRRLGMPGDSTGVTVHRLDGADQAKDFFHVEDLGSRFASVGPVHALVFPAASPQGGHFRMRGDQARRHLTADSLREIHGGNRDNAVRLAHLAIRYPAYRARLVQDIDCRVAMMESIADDVRGSCPAGQPETRSP